MQRSADGRCPQLKGRESAERGSAEDVGRVVRAKCDARDRDQGGEDERQYSTLAVAQQDGHGDGVGAGGVVGRERRVGRG